MAPKIKLGKLNVHKDVKNDVLIVEQTVQTSYGAARVQAVVNLPPLRDALKNVEAKGGVSGLSPEDREAHVNRAAVKGCTKLSKLAGFGPALQLAKQAGGAAMKAQGAKYAKVQKIVEAYKKDKLKSVGGFPGLEKKMTDARKKDSLSKLTRGIPPQLVKVQENRARHEDEDVLKAAANEVGVEFNEGAAEAAEDKSEEGDGGGEEAAPHSSPAHKHQDGAHGDLDFDGNPTERPGGGYGDGGGNFRFSDSDLDNPDSPNDTNASSDQRVDVLPRTDRPAGWPMAGADGTDGTEGAFDSAGIWRPFRKKKGPTRDQRMEAAQKKIDDAAEEQAVRDQEAAAAAAQEALKAKKDAGDDNDNKDGDNPPPPAAPPGA